MGQMRTVTLRAHGQASVTTHRPSPDIPARHSRVMADVSTKAIARPRSIHRIHALIGTSLSAHPVLKCRHCGCDYHGQVLKGRRHSFHTGKECPGPWRVKSQPMEAQFMEILADQIELPRNWKSQLKELASVPAEDHSEARAKLNRRLENGMQATSNGRILTTQPIDASPWRFAPSYRKSTVANLVRVLPGTCRLSQKRRYPDKARDSYQSTRCAGTRQGVDSDGVQPH